jgi:hypothetical protein
MSQLVGRKLLGLVVAAIDSLESDMLVSDFACFRSAYGLTDPVDKVGDRAISRVSTSFKLGVIEV